MPTLSGATIFPCSNFDMKDGRGNDTDAATAEVGAGIINFVVFKAVSA